MTNCSQRLYVLQQPVHSVAAASLLAVAIQGMLMRDIGRLFVHDPQDGPMVGVLSLSDAVRFRSGSCRACVSGRMMTADRA